MGVFKAFRGSATALRQVCEVKSLGQKTKSVPGIASHLFAVSSSTCISTWDTHAITCCLGAMGGLVWEISSIK